MTVATCFISYNHADKALAQAIATGLGDRGYRVWIDQGNLRAGDSLVSAISAAIEQVDFLISLVSEQSVASEWCQKEISLAMTGEIARQGITVIPCRVGNVSMPASLADKLYVQINTDDPTSAVQRLASDMARHLEPPNPLPPRRRQPNTSRRATKQTAPTPARSAGGFTPMEAVRMTGIDVAGIGHPRNDGTPGSALYLVPINLSVVPDSTWAQLFGYYWRNPPRWTTMHRASIGSISGGRILLDGTTVEEVEKYHLDTLRGVVDATNEERKRLAEEDQRKQDQVRRQREQHEQASRDAAARIKFD